MNLVRAQICSVGKFSHVSEQMHVQINFAAVFLPSHSRRIKGIVVLKARVSSPYVYPVADSRLSNESFSLD